MVTLEQILALAGSGESETLEFKTSTGERREAMHALCGMVNHLGGKVLFGVLPDGTVRGQQVSDHTLEEIAQEIREIDPPIFPVIDRVNVREDIEVVVVSVTQGQVPPYKYKGYAYRRVGNTNQKLSNDEYNQILLERLHGQIRWENQPAEDWTVSDLDTDEIVFTVEESIRRGRADEPGTRDPVMLLRGLGLMRNRALLRAGVVLFGRQKRLEVEYPQCMLRVARFRGTDRTEFLDNRQFQGHIFDLLARAERYLRENLPVAGRVLPGLFERVDDPLYPPLALREALANAFCHREYSIGGGSVAVGIYDDRLEVTSSGSLHFGLTADTLFQPHESLPWNPLIAGVLYRRGVIERWGRGTLKILELVQQAGLPTPEIEDSGGYVCVRFHPGSYAPPLRVARDLTERQRDILALVEKHHRGLALREIHSGVGRTIPEWQVKNDLAALKHLGLLKSTGHGRGARWILVSH